jgi:hypothetical protein
MLGFPFACFAFLRLWLEVGEGGVRITLFVFLFVWAFWDGGFWRLVLIWEWLDWYVLCCRLSALV